LAEQISTIANVHIDAVEHGDKIVFLHAVKEGPANQSYGLQVAQLAGVPREVIAQARKKLVSLEQQREQAPQTGQTLPLSFAETPAHKDTATETDIGANQLRDKLASYQPDELTPRQALNALYELQQLLSDQSD